MPRDAQGEDLKFRGSTRELLMGIKGDELLWGEFWGLDALGTATSMLWG